MAIGNEGVIAKNVRNVTCNFLRQTVNKSYILFLFLFKVKVQQIFKKAIIPLLLSDLSMV